MIIVTAGAFGLGYLVEAARAKEELENAESLVIHWSDFWVKKTKEENNGG